MFNSVHLLLIYSSQMSLFIIFHALLDVYLFLLLSELLTVVSNDITHPIHDSLDSLTTVERLLLTSFILFNLHANIVLHLVDISFLDLFKLSHSLFLVILVVSDNFHCSLTLLNLFLSISLSIVFCVSCKFGDALSFFVLHFSCIIDLLLFDLFEHIISHFLLLDDFSLKNDFLLFFNFELFPGLSYKTPIELFILFSSFFAELYSKLDLLVQYFLDLLSLRLVLGLLLSDLLFMKFLSKLLDLSPLVITDIRW